MLNCPGLYPNRLSTLSSFLHALQAPSLPPTVTTFLLTWQADFILLSIPASTTPKLICFSPPALLPASLILVITVGQWGEYAAVGAEVCKLQITKTF